MAAITPVIVPPKNGLRLKAQAQDALRQSQARLKSVGSEKKASRLLSLFHPLLSCVHERVKS
jgi:hypothetical protein